MKKVNEQLLRIMQAIEERAELNPKGSVFVVGPDLFVDCPDYESLLEKLEQDYKAIAIEQRPDEQHLDYDQLAMIESSLTDYYSYRLKLTSGFEPLLAQLSNTDAPQASVQPTSDPDTAQHKVKFSARTSTLTFGDKKCEIPEATLQYYVCKLAVNKGVAKEQDIIDAYDENNTSQQPVRDAIKAINRKANQAFGIENLLRLSRGKVRVSKKYP